MPEKSVVYVRQTPIPLNLDQHIVLRSFLAGDCPAWVNMTVSPSAPSITRSEFNLFMTPEQALITGRALVAAAIVAAPDIERRDAA